MALVDPIKQLRIRLEQRAKHIAEVVAEAAMVDDELPFEIALIPEPGSRVRQLTIASTYRDPIPVLVDQRGITYPISAKR
jgi:hypothetical protein